MLIREVLLTFFWPSRLPEEENSRSQRLQPRPYTAAEVIANERRFIAESHPEACGDGSNKLGLALSGGGIRSATINLGLLQALANFNILEKVAYLSTVSGGGYIGSWLAAWASRAGFKQVCESLKNNRGTGPAPADSSERNDPHFFEPDPVHRLRKYTSYLTPKVGPLSRDTWTVVAIYLRNLLLNQSLLFSWTFVALCLLQLVVLAYRAASTVPPSPVSWWATLKGGAVSAPVTWPWWTTLIACGLFALVVVATARAWRQFDEPVQLKGDDSKSVSWWARLWMSACIASAVFLSFALTPGPKHFWPKPLGFPAQNLEWWFAMAGALTVSAGSALVCVYMYSLRRRMMQSRDIPLQGVSNGPWRRLLAAPVAGMVAGFLLYVCWRLFQSFPESSDVGAHLTVVATPLVLISFVFATYVHIGVMGLEFPDAKREWLGAAAGTLLKVALIWAGVAALTIYGPRLIALLLSPLLKEIWKPLDMLKWFLPGGWAASVITGLWAGHSPKTGSPDGNKYYEVMAKIAPWLFIAGMLMILPWILVHVTQPHNLKDWWQTPEHWRALPDNWHSLKDFTLEYWLMFGVSLAVGLLLFIVFDPNEFSMHLFYRNRLVRAYLGASNETRRPNPFTKFAKDDDVFLADLGLKENCVTRTQGQKPYDGPYPLICTALNLVAGTPLEWQERKAASFIYSPLFCGYDKLPSGTRVDETPGYRPTRVRIDADSHIGFSGEWGPPLGTAMAASGAAISPNMGYHSSLAVTALLTIFNVRLGWWVGNPGIRRDKWTRYGPGPIRLFYELLSHADDDGDYVYLSDGGHFENLGIYELVRRRVPLIIACDAGQDGGFTFGDLGKAIEKCRRDFGAEIDIDVSGIKGPKDALFNSAHFAVGKINYKRLEGADPQDTLLGDFAQDDQKGWLLYIKSSLTGDEHGDVLAHRNLKAAFPHDPTMDQFFSESTFESYRRLGEDIVTHTLNSLLKDVRTRDLESLMQCLRRYYEAPRKKEAPNDVQVAIAMRA